MGLFIVGMHRSGTSAATQALATLPFELPDEDAMVGSDVSNPRGHWEVRALMELTEELLARAGGAWFAPTMASIRSMAELVDPTYGIEATASAAFRATFSTDHWLLKDPRLSLTLPFWRQVAPPSQAAVFVQRDPLSVAHSLRGRNGLALRHGLALWERYSRSALSGLAGLPVFVVDYSTILAGGTGVEDLIDFASDLLGPVADDRSRGERLAAFEAVIELDLRHHRPSDETLDQLLSAPQRHLRDVLDGLSGGHESFQPPTMGRETPALDLLFESTRSMHDFDRAETDEAMGRTERGYDARLDEAREYTTSLEAMVNDGAKAQELMADEHREAEAAALDEIDRLRALFAASDAEWGELAGLDRTIGELRHELALTVHERNVNAQKLLDFLDRPAVKRSLWVAGKWDRIAGTGAAEDEPEAPRAVAARLPDWAHLRDQVDNGVLQRRLTVLIPIYNAVEAVQRCLDAVERYTPSDVDLLLIDDCSTDERIGVMLGRLRERPGLRILRNDVNLGFPTTVNRGLAEVADGDVIILNSDTMVTPRWTWRLRLAANERPDIGTVTPLSDHAGVFSFDSPVPTGAENGATIAAGVARASEFLRPTGPTGNGFCLYVRREALDIVAGFDADAFPRGYGEENDFCMKLGEAGLEHVIADDVVVFHEESASFGDELRVALIADGLRVLNERHPGYDDLARRFVESPAFTAARRIAGQGAMAADSTTRPRVLHVMHAGGGGTEYFARDLARSSKPWVESLLLMPDEDVLRLWRLDGDEWVIETEWVVPGGWDIRRTRDHGAAEIALEVLSRYDVSLVHIQHLIGLTLDLPYMAEALGIPVVMSLHDFYMVCPAVNLLDDQLQYCRGVCTEGDGHCQTPVLLPDDLPLKHRFVHLWRHETTELLAHIPALVAPSEDTRDRYLATFGAEIAPRLAVIEHGRDFSRQRVHGAAPRADQPVRLLLVGGINQSKGSTLARELAAVGAQLGVSVEVLGKVEPGLELDMICHGEYRRDELLGRLAALRPTFVGLFSLWPETHCYVLSEAWASGVPVMAGPLGAPAERIRRHGGGVVLDELDPGLIIDAVVRYGRDRSAYLDLARSASVDNVRSMADMTADWVSLYGDLQSGARGWVV